MQNVTLLAPVNSAYVKAVGSLEPWEEYDLLRYVLNQKVFIGNLTGEEVIYESLYNNTNGNPYPVKLKSENDVYVVDNEATIVESDIYAKHQRSYIQAIDKLLPIKETMCEALLNSEDESISIVRQMFRSLFADDTDTLGKKKKKKKHGKHKPKPLPKSCAAFLQDVKTIMVPSNNVFKKSLDELQLKYYLVNTDSAEFDTTEEAEFEINSDIIELLRHLMFKEYIGGVNGTENSVISLAGQKQRFSTHKGNITIAHFSTNQSAALADGLIQIFEDGEEFFQHLKIPTVEMIARKALFAHHYSNVVNELKFRSLDTYIDGSAVNQTIIVDIDSRDDVSDDEIRSLSFSSKQELMYHFIDETIDFSSTPHVLVNTRLCSKKKLGGCYKIKVSKTEGASGSKYIVGDGAEVLETVAIGNESQIFITKEEISTPLNLKHSLGDLMSNGALPPSDGLQIDRSGCVRTLRYFGSFDMLSLKDIEQGYTIFLPCGMTDSGVDEGLWNDLGLVLNYLEANPAVFQNITRGMFLKKTLYSNFRGSEMFKDVDDDSVRVKSLSTSKETNQIEVANDVFNLPLNSDVLFNQGVIHVVNKVILPHDFYIPIGDLIATTFDASLPDFSIAHLLDVFPDIKKSLKGKNPYSLLIPQPDSLKDFNITKSFSSLYSFLQFHLIPNEEAYKLVDCALGQNVKDIIRTNLTKGGLLCKHTSKKGQVMLKLRKLNGTDTVADSSYNKNQEVKLLSHGCTLQGNTSSRSCVFLIDKPLSLQWFEKKSDNFLHIHLGIVSLGVGIILGLIIFGGVMIGLVLFMGRRGHPRRKPSIDDELPRADSGFMSVLTDDEDYIPYDRGYETDIEVLRSETEGLLPSSKKKRKIRHNDYGSIRSAENGPSVTLPRDIGNIKSNLARERNLPGVSQF
ncbi:hypothetical protein CANMA_000231 [Candida margitis]|uniref:uncharacterized protein n=1 Tax=Candida margitis TaxID=1775924 RepID=UPI002227774D|nr:uncharacterized protein CANMA_000231 [Candida margitis]KAI5970812.1 hypothetical protein CANMA_000231 [Candida margitis]